MKKYFARFFSLILALAVTASLTACGGKNPENPTDSANSSGDSDKVYEIRLASTQADGNDLDQTLDLFAQLCDEKSNGRLKITVYPGNILGDELSTTEMCQHDQLEMTMTSVGVLENFCPEFAVICLPNLFKDYTHVVNATRSAWGDTLKEAAEKQNMKILGYTCNGFMNLGTVGKPVATISDLAGMNIRCIESESTIAILTKWGCNPNPMAFSEVPTSLQLGAIDGCFLNPLVFLSTGIADLLDYYTADWSVGIGLCPVMISAKYFNSLPADLQTIIEDAFVEAEDDGFRRTEENQAANVAKMEEKGVTLVHSTEEQLAEVDRGNKEVVWPALIDMGITTQDTIDQILATAE